MDSIKERLEKVEDRIKKSAAACNRKPETICLVAVSKTVPADRVREAIEAGVKILGENYVQEAREKVNSLTDFPVNWHFIGHLQTNKAKYAVRLFDLIHSVDSLKLARELNKQAQKNGKNQQILIQVNISQENKNSCIFVDEAVVLISEIGQLDNLSIKGLMTMSPYFNQPERVQPFFAALR